MQMQKGKKLRLWQILLNNLHIINEFVGMYPLASILIQNKM